jgi:O-antigen/teichoic acid export membrane protein
MKRHLTELAGRLHRYGRNNPNVAQGIAAFAIKLVGAALSFAFSFLIARHLGAEGTGAYALATTTAIFAATVAFLGLDYVLLRTMAGDLREGKPALARGVAASALRVTGLSALLIGAALALLGVPVLRQLFGREVDVQLVYLAAFAVLPFTLNRMAVVSLRGAGGILAAQWLEGPLSMLLALLVFGGFLLSGTPIGATGVVILYFATVTLAAIVATLIYQGRARHWPAPQRMPVRPLIAQGWRIWLIVLSRYLVDWLVLVSLGAWFSTFEVGQYRTAWQIAALIMLIVTTFDSVAGPRIAAAWRVGDVTHIRQVMRQSVATMAVIASPLIIVSLGWPEWLLGLFGPDFVAGATALRILALGQMVNILAGPVGTVMLMMGEERTSFIVSLVALAALGLLCLTLIPAYGLIGAALTTSLIIVLRTVVTWALVRRKLTVMTQ